MPIYTVSARYLDLGKLKRLLVRKFGKEFPDFQPEITFITSTDILQYTAPGLLTELELSSCRSRSTESFKFAEPQRQSPIDEWSTNPEKQHSSELKVPANAESVDVPTAWVDTVHSRLVVPQDTGYFVELKIRPDQGISFPIFPQGAISSGFTSDVFEVSAKWVNALQKEGDAVPMDEHGKKEAYSNIREPLGQSKDLVEYSQMVAVKVLRSRIPKDHFEHEFSILREITFRDHANIARSFAAFQLPQGESQRYYFIFPLAQCNLKQLFRNNLAPNKPIPEQVSSLSQSLWYQFEGLSSGLEFLHETCNIAHRDLKPSNILIFGGKDSAYLSAKIADFGLSSKLDGARTYTVGTHEYSSAVKYDAPEIKKRLREHGHTLDTFQVRTDLLKGDVWKMGAIFIELLTFLILGSQGVGNFRKSITITEGYVTTDDIATFDDGERVKPAVLTWLRGLAQRDSRAAEIMTLLERMFEVASNRPHIKEITRCLRQYSFSTYWDGSRVIRFQLAKAVPPRKIADRCKAALERLVGAQIDWWPLHQGLRTCRHDRVRLSWHWGDRELSVDVNNSSAEQYRQQCTPMSQAASSEPGVPMQPPPVYRPSGLSQSTQDTFQQMGNLRSSDLSQSGQVVAVLDDQRSGLAQDHPQVLEVYWCVDKCYREPRETAHSRIIVSQGLSDRALFKRLGEDYTQIRGWRARVFSWKSCQRIDFIKDPRRVKYLEIGLPPKSPASTYEYIFKPPEDVHRAIAETQIQAGMSPWRFTRSFLPKNVTYEPDTLGMLPKRKDAESDWPVGMQEWGIYARQGYSLFKAIRWMFLLTVLCFGLYGAWLGLRGTSNESSQNALSPIGVVIGLITTAITVLQSIDDR